MTAPPLKQARSGTHISNLQEVIDAGGGSVAHSLGAGQQQYFTPRKTFDAAVHKLGQLGVPNAKWPSTVLDPQCGEGALVSYSNGYSTQRYGCDIDNRLASNTGGQVNLITGNCVRAFEALDDLYPDTRWWCINANPPFGRKFKQKDGSVVDSTVWTWDFVIKHGCFGTFISNADTIEKLGIDKHPWVIDYSVVPGSELWTGMRDELRIGIVLWRRPKLTPEGVNDWYASGYELSARWAKVKEVIEEEKLLRPKFNIYLDNSGLLKTYLSIRKTTKLKLTREDILKLTRINGSHPLTLTTERETRDLMNELIKAGLYDIEPKALESIQEALRSVNKLACPIMPITDFESVAYADEEEALECVQDTIVDETEDGKRRTIKFTRGKRYPISTATYRFTEKFVREKLHFDEQTQSQYTVPHECARTGEDKYIAIRDDCGDVKKFMDKPGLGVVTEFEESMLWSIFKRPNPNTIAEADPSGVEKNTAILIGCEQLVGYKYYPGQLSYLARVGCKDHALIAADVGTGKSLMALSLIAMKAPERTLIVAPQGTMRTSESDDDSDEDGEGEMPVSQWLSEIHRFAPYLQVWELFSMEDYDNICAVNGGTLPAGVFVTYPDAFFRNGAMEVTPPTWDDKRLGKEIKTILQSRSVTAELEPPDESLDKRYWCDSVGHEENGIRCIIKPCMATLIGHHFDAVMIDESHCVSKLSACISQMLIRLQPKYRYAFTATPIFNIVSNLFPIMGWLCVPEWFRGGRRNAAWPYAREDINRFNDTFLSEERDHTQEQRNREANPDWRGKCVKKSPVISSPARLLKILKPTIAYISKERVNIGYKPAKIVEVRVPLGQQQAKLYGHFLDRANIPAKHPLIRARKQGAFLRAICADPTGFSHHTVKSERLAVSSNFNPKVNAILELVATILREGEQVVIINSRVGLTTMLADRLREARVPFSRIDSTIQAEQHSGQANLFKSGKSRVMFMGLRCAASHSFSQCKYGIIGSIDFTPGALRQGVGRIDRVNSRPDVTVWCILHKGSMEEVMFDTTIVKDDAATICLRGQRVPRGFVPVAGEDILVNSIRCFDVTGAVPESESEAAWPKLKDAIMRAQLSVAA